MIRYIQRIRPLKYQYLSLLAEMFSLKYNNKDEENILSRTMVQTCNRVGLLCLFTLEININQSISINI